MRHFKSVSTRLALFLTLPLAACESTAVVGDATPGAGGSDDRAEAGEASPAGATSSASGAGAGAGGASGAGARRVDLLFSIDNSRSMADKQQVLALALADLMGALTNPPCVDAEGQATAHPAGPSEPCPQGSQRAHLPVDDIHVGVISSSLGAGASPDFCPSPEPLDTACYPNGGKHSTTNDKGRLLHRSAPTMATNDVPTHAGFGFLAWDPSQKLSPPGVSEAATLVDSFKSMVLGVGQLGCGFEAQLESIYRFLVDPAPYESLEAGKDGQALRTGIDTFLLEQRKRFLRPDSVLAVVSLSDENDCSVREDGAYWQVLASEGVPKGRAICQTDPNDPCCVSCGAIAPPGCPEDPTCAEEEAPPGGAVNLRCFDQKRRFGLDFLYPTSRYVSALTDPLVPDASGNLVKNPIFSDLDPSDDATAVRDASRVLFAGIVGVPWQDIARDPGNPGLGFKSGAELEADTGKGGSTWDVILGDPAKGVPPLDPLMVESPLPRSGANPITGAPLTLEHGENPINGNEWEPTLHDDLQYACVFAIHPDDHRDCTDGCDSGSGCDCDGDDQANNPLCAPGEKGNSLQVRAKAYPAPRQLEVIKGLGDRGVVGSVCPPQIVNPASPDYAYRPVVRTLLERLTPLLAK